MKICSEKYNQSALCVVKCKKCDTIFVILGCKKAINRIGSVVATTGSLRTVECICCGYWDTETLILDIDSFENLSEIEELLKG